MSSVNVFAIVFNQEERCFETKAYKDVPVREYDEYSDVVAVDVVPVHCKLNIVNIAGNSGYLISESCTDDEACLKRILDKLKERSQSVADIEMDKLKLLEKVKI